MREELLRGGELAAKVGISRTTLYAHINLGYVFKYPILRKTTLEHYLEWASKQPVPEKSASSLRRERERDLQRQASASIRPTKPRAHPA